MLAIYSTVLYTIPFIWDLGSMKIGIFSMCSVYGLMTKAESPYICHHFENQSGLGSSHSKAYVVIPSNRNEDCT